MPLVVAKMVMAPLLIGASSWVAKRWGGAVGGWLLGLPLTSGPISVFLFMEHGAGFARSAARGALLGLVATALFCLSYAATVRRESWWRSLAAAYLACFGAVWLLSHAQVSFVSAVVFVLGALMLLAWMIGAPERDDLLPAPAARGLAIRMAVASACVCAITAAATLLGPTVAGMLAPLPVLGALMAGSAHRSGRRDATQGLLRGAVLGSWAGAGFFAVVGAMLGPFGAVATYATATGVALASGALAMRINVRGA